MLLMYRCPQPGFPVRAPVPQPPQKALLPHLHLHRQRSVPPQRLRRGSPPVDEQLAVQPVITAVLAKRTASSSCHGARLNLGADPGTFTCRDCGQPCERLLSEPQEVTAHA